MGNNIKICPILTHETDIFNPNKHTEDEYNARKSDTKCDSVTVIHKNTYCRALENYFRGIFLTFSFRLLLSNLSFVS